MMSRTQVTLEPELKRQVRERSRELGISFAEYIRRLVIRDLGSLSPQPSPRIIFDLGSSGGSDIAAHKDRMVGEAVEQRHRNRRKR